MNEYATHISSFVYKISFYILISVMFLHFRIQRKHMQEGEVSLYFKIAGWKFLEETFDRLIVNQLHGHLTPGYCLDVSRLWEIRWIVDAATLQLEFICFYITFVLRNLFCVILSIRERKGVVSSSSRSFYVHSQTRIFSGISLCAFIWPWSWRSSWRWYLYKPSVSCSFHINYLVKQPRN